MANMAKIEDKLKILPAMPGCYLMKNKGRRYHLCRKSKKAEAARTAVFCRRPRF